MFDSSRLVAMVAVGVACAWGGGARAGTPDWVPYTVSANCTADTDCGDGGHCRQPGTDQCCSGAYCGDFPMCGTCEKLGAACSSDKDCGSGEFCPIVLESIPCCPPGEVCGEGIRGCFCTLQTNKCWTDADCGMTKTQCQNLVNCGADTNCPGPYDCAVPVSTCTTEKDCATCQVCASGKCEGTGVVECTADGDCAGGEYCEVNPDAPCKNHCASKVCQLVDCAGQCDFYGQACPSGQTCVETIKGCCGMCHSDVPACKVDEDCGACKVCESGTCKWTGAIACNRDEDCAAGSSCMVADAAACKNQCVAVADGVQPDAQAEVVAPDEPADGSQLGEELCDSAQPEAAQPDTSVADKGASPEAVADAAASPDAVETGAETIATADGAGVETSSGSSGGGAACSASTTGTPGGSLILVVLALVALAGRVRRTARRPV